MMFNRVKIIQFFYESTKYTIIFVVIFILHSKCVTSHLMKCNNMKTSCNVLLLFLLITVFLVACSNENTTFALYDINGTVTDNGTNLPLKKIRLIRQGTSYLLFNDTTYTDSLGRYSFSLTDYYSKKATFSLKVEDADGELNGGEFMTQNINVQFLASDWSFVDLVGDYKGQAIKNQDIKLMKK